MKTSKTLLFSREGDITGVQIMGQLPLLEYKKHIWILWLEYNETRSEGVYLELRPHGSIVKVVKTGKKEVSTDIKPMEK
ncbi:MAG TPA: hypothetical protein VIY48_13540 [Candidatus Paceibacterota bacterium]